MNFVDCVACVVLGGHAVNFVTTLISATSGYPS